jgi:subtilisin family serine protease
MKTLLRFHSIRVAILFLTLALATNLRLEAQPFADDAEFVPDEVIVQFKSTAGDQQLADALRKGALTVKEHLPSRGKRAGDSGLALLKTKLSVPQALAALQNHPAIEYAEPNMIKRHQASYVANDSYYTSGKLWGMYGDLSSPANPYGSHAAQAWKAGNIGSANIYVAVIDEGVDISHPDLAPNIGTNPGEIAGDGIDNDGNGYIDDIYGWDFLHNDNTVFDGGADKDDHGTHVSGTIGAAGGNSIGVAGVCWNIKLLVGKFMSSKGGTIADEVKAIEYFIDLKQRHGLNLVAFNASFGGGKSLTEQIALIHAAKANILFVAAAGNYGWGYPFYPAAYDTSVNALNADGTVAETGASYDAVISVAAIDSKGALASFSDYSATLVDLGAPGVNIYSTLPGGRYGSMDGTSMATPHVTGSCALYLSSHPGAFPWDIKAAILNSVIPTASLSGKTVTGGRLNVGGF